MTSTLLKMASLSLLVALLGCSEQASEKPKLEKAIGVNLNNVKQHIKTLASDDFEGRGPLTNGEVKTVSYLADQYKAMGLTGAYKNKFLQPVEMAMITADQNMQLKIGELTFKAGTDFTARTQQLQPLIDVRDSDVLFVGYGINAPEYNWNDYKDIDVTGKTVVM
ncbi:MAG: M28 family metallopeptidase, partial [Pseudoalteromonas sp.]